MQFIAGFPVSALDQDPFALRDQHIAYEVVALYVGGQIVVDAPLKVAVLAGKRGASSENP
jgi:hypothetical protein